MSPITQKNGTGNISELIPPSNKHYPFSLFKCRLKEKLNVDLSLISILYILLAGGDFIFKQIMDGMIGLHST